MNTNITKLTTITLALLVGTTLCAMEPEDREGERGTKRKRKKYVVANPDTLSDVELIEYFLNCEAPRTKQTPLEKAIEQNKVDLIKRVGALTDINTVPCGKKNPLQCATRCNHQEIIDYLLATPSINLYQKGEEPESFTYDAPLHAAIDHKNVTVVQKLLEKGASTTPKNCCSPLRTHLLTRKPSWEIVTLLMQSGCNINETNREGSSTLHQVILNKKTPNAKKMLSLGADIFQRNPNNGFTALECVHTLIKAPKTLSTLIKTAWIDRLYQIRIVAQQVFDKIFPWEITEHIISDILENEHLPPTISNANEALVRYLITPQAIPALIEKMPLKTRIKQFKKVICADIEKIGKVTGQKLLQAAAISDATCMGSNTI